MKSLTGLQIFKYLPGGKKEKESNCKKCGFPTCMAFAMKLAKKEVAIDKCEYMSEELKALLEEAGQSQQAEITFGPEKNKITVGNEIVMFRHDKKFVNSACLCIKLNSSDINIISKVNEIANYSVERVGEDLKINAINLYDTGTPQEFHSSAKMIAEMDIPLILSSSSPINIENILKNVSKSRPLIHLKHAEIKNLAKIHKEFNVPVVISGNSIENLAINTSYALENGIEDIVISLDKSENENLIENLTYIRRSAIENKFKPLGFPVITFMDKLFNNCDSVIDKAIWASALICKYSNIIVLDDFDKAVAYSLLTLRQNIYTDPQKPLQTEPKIYSIGDVDENSPVLVTTNFALTYFTVVSEIESSNIPTYVLVTPSDGMSVLTAWAASKFTGETIAKAIKDFNLESYVKHKKLIIPGYVSSLKEEILEELPDWEVIIGVNEAVEIPDFLRNYKTNFVNNSNII